MAYCYLFGPVNSRRLGRSLGVDLVPPKVCTLDCVYCESGRTTRHTGARDEYVPTAAVLAELDAFLGTRPELDYVTFSGAGEPTLHRGLGTVIAHLKARHPQYRVALITNGTLLGDPAVRREVCPCDLIVPSLDAATDAVMATVNRPVPGCTAAGLIDALVALRGEYRGQLWLEIFIVPGVNDTDAELAALAAAAARIRPDRIQLNALDRPAPDAWVRAADRDRLAVIARHFTGPVDVIARHHATASGSGTVTAAAVLEILRRRPSTAADLAHGLQGSAADLDRLLVELERRGLIRPETRDGLTFFHCR
ncbi:MAG TPA: radical SAM protein [bacterium]|nr:radical SAM protein [bacterium]